MRTERLVGILTVLMQQKKTTASQLAQKFEVSVRTIQRDIEALSIAGIPVTAERGSRGGISIMEGYTIDKTLLSLPDLDSILTGLKGLDSIAAGNQYRHLIQKLAAGQTIEHSRHDEVLIDLASFYKGSVSGKIQLLQQSIREKQEVSFVYYSSHGESNRHAEPYQVVFQWGAWYLWAYCKGEKDFHLFKLNRLWALRQTGAVFVKRETPSVQNYMASCFPEKIRLQAVFENQVKWRLIEAYGPDCFSEQADGRLLFDRGFTNQGYLVHWLLGFGSQVQVLRPIEIARALKAEAQCMNEFYSHI